MIEHFLHYDIKGGNHQHNDENYGFKALTQK